MMKKVPGLRLLKNVVPAFAALLSLCCAGNYPPSGGPEDKTPPVIKITVPEPGALHVTSGPIRIEFSKYVDRTKLQNSIFFSPSVGDLSFDWGNTDVSIGWTDSLRPNTTYIMTIGTDLTDTRGNRLAHAFSLPFSTGDHIDSASVAGSVVDPKSEGVMIFAYRLDKIPGRGDTLNPSLTKPDYLTQTGAGGTFTLRYLAVGSYRLIAVRDELKNLLYDIQTDAYGVLPADLTMTADQPRLTGVHFRMTADDTTRPFLSSVRSTDRTHILLRFSKPMDPVTLEQSTITIADTLSNAPLAVRNASLSEGDLFSAVVVTDTQTAGRTYRVVARGMTDSHSLILRQTGTGEYFAGSSEPDTVKPVVELRYPVDHARPLAVDDSIRFSFSEPVRKDPLETAISLLDSTGRARPVRLVWMNATGVTLIPTGGLLPDSRYNVKLILDSLSDYSGNRWRDSAALFPMQTITDEVLSSIQGSVADNLPGGRGPIVITVKNITAGSEKTRTVSIPGPGTFMIGRCTEGMYVLSVYRDADSSGRYSFGSPFPFHPSERFALYPDTLKLRARWPLEGVKIVIPAAASGR